MTTKIDGSHIRTPEDLRIFCAALTGICANPAFFGPIMQQEPRAAVGFAAAVVRVTQGGSDAD